MNDDFLHRLRVQPPLEFSVRLAANLQVPPGATRSARRSPIRRAWPALVLLAGAAFAAASPAVRAIVSHAWSTLLTVYSNAVPAVAPEAVLAPRPKSASEGAPAVPAQAPAQSSLSSNLTSPPGGDTALDQPRTLPAASESNGFDTVKITKAPGKGPAGIGIGNNETLSVRNRSLRTIIAFAYDVDRGSVVGGPDWLDKQAYNIVAHARAAVKSGDDMLPLVKTLLADRFGLQVHPDVRQLAVFVLSVGQGGSRLSSSPAFSSELPGEHHPNPGISADDDTLVATHISLKAFSQDLSLNMGGPAVLDQTGLSGTYDFTLRGPRTPEALPAELQEQLGLQLDAVTAPINVIVVDDVHEPTLDVQSASASSAEVPAGAR
jgi:uncharacterized protein (TIGR03435 family)